MLKNCISVVLFCFNKLLLLLYRYTRKGFLFKSFNMQAILTDGIKPTLAELERFDEGSLTELEVSTKDSEKHSYAPGDRVEVTEGELTHLTGEVTRVDGPSVFIKPSHQELNDELEFTASEIRKFFKMGDHVKVIAGRYENDTGLIVRVEDNLIVLFR